MMRQTWSQRERWSARPADLVEMNADEDGVGGDDGVDSLSYLVARKSPGLQGEPVLLCERVCTIGFPKCLC